MAASILRLYHLTARHNKIPLSHVGKLSVIMPSQRAISNKGCSTSVIHSVAWVPFAANANPFCWGSLPISSVVFNGWNSIPSANANNQSLRARIALNYFIRSQTAHGGEGMESHMILNTYRASLQLLYKNATRVLLFIYAYTHAHKHIPL